MPLASTPTQRQLEFWGSAPSGEFLSAQSPVLSGLGDFASTRTGMRQVVFDIYPLWCSVSRGDHFNQQCLSMQSRSSTLTRTCGVSGCHPTGWRPFGFNTYPCLGEIVKTHSTIGSAPSGLPRRCMPRHSGQDSIVLSMEVGMIWMASPSCKKSHHSDLCVCVRARACACKCVQNLSGTVSTRPTFSRHSCCTQP